MKNLFKRRRFSFWYFVLMVLVFILAIVFNYLLHTTEAVTCLTTGAGLCEIIGLYTLYEILAYVSIILFVLLIIYPILFNSRLAEEKVVENVKQTTTKEYTKHDVEEETTAINDEEEVSNRDIDIIPIPLGINFKENPVIMPRRLRINVLKDVLKAMHQNDLEELERRLAENENSLGITDYMRLHKLRVYDGLSEYQLEKEMDLYNNALINDQYEQKLWIQIEGYLKRAYGDDYRLALDSLPRPDKPIKSVRAYNKVLLPHFIDEENEYDGINCKMAVEHFVGTSTRKELFELGEKYDVMIPKYLTKADLKLRLFKGLSEQGKLDDSMQEKVDQASVKNLKALLEENNLNADPYYTKVRMVEMLMQLLCDRRDALKPVEELEKSSQEMVIDFAETPVVMQRQLRVKVLRETLEKRHLADLKTLQKAVDEAPNSLGIKDYMRLNKLKSHNSLSEYQLEKLMDYYKDDALNQDYVDNLWASIDTYLSRLYDSEVKEKAMDSLPKDESIKNIQQYNKTLFPFFTDKLGEFDGIDCKKAVDHLVATSSRKELFELADKYGINVPKYLTKADLKERLINGLVAQDKLNDSMKDSIEQASVKVLKQMLEENNLNADPYYTKEKMVEMMIEMFCQLK